MSTTFFYLYRFLINVMATLTGVLTIYGFWLLAFNMVDNPYVQIVVFMLGIILGVLFGSYLLVMLLIPFQMQKQFDSIKNKVAMQEYASVDEFQQAVAEFMIKFFRFPGANVVGGKFEFKGANALYLNIDKASWTDFDISQKAYDRKQKAHGMEVILGSIHLGRFYIVTQGLVMPLFSAIIQDFENYMLDDQLMHVINYTKDK